MGKLWSCVRVCAIAVALCWGAGVVAQAVDDGQTAHELVATVADDLKQVVQDNQASIEGRPEIYFRAIEQVLDPVVDFSYIVRGVMGRHGKQATPAQRRQFAQVFKRSLVATYAKGMASYADQDIVILPPNGDISGQRRVSVRQEVRSEGGVSHVSFSMRLNKQGQWKLVNVVLDGINLGRLLRNQFFEAVNKNEGDIDKVIANWSSEA